MSATTPKPVRLEKAAPEQGTPRQEPVVSGLTGLRQLTKRAQFLRAARGKRAGARFFALQTVPSTFNVAGIGFTVTKKVGNAPVRNRLKRRLRAAVKACNAEFNNQYDYVLIGRREALDAPFTGLVDGLKTLITRVHANGHPAQKS